MGAPSELSVAITTNRGGLVTVAAGCSYHYSARHRVVLLHAEGAY
ncbi:hypothetical protein [Pseudoclavibacter helvolus]